MTAERVAERIAHPKLDYRAIDVDNHYYETIDSCTRHLPKEFKRRGVQMLTEGKRTFAVMGGVVNHFIPNPTFDPIIEPGCLDLLFRGEIPEGVDPASLMKVDRLADHPEYQNRDARVKILDKQNLETVFMLPTFACGVEEALKHDIEATMATVHAFNLWLDEDWGFDRPDHRFISAPIISLADPDKAVEEVEFVLSRGAKIVCVRPAPVPGVVKPRSLGDPLHDPVWARLAEAGVPVVFHLSDSGYLAIAALWGGKATFEGFGKKDPLDQILLDDRAIHDTMASMIVHQVFTRHPEAEGRQHRERLLLRVPLDQAAEEGRQHRAVPLQGGSGRAAAEQRLDRPVLRGRREAARRDHRRGQDPVRLGLAARRGARGSDDASPRTSRSSPSSAPKTPGRSCGTTPLSCSA